MNRFEDIKNRILDSEGDWQLLAIEFGINYWSEIPWLVSQLEKAIEVINFYADKDNWDDSFTPTIWDDGNVDCGEKAKEFLEQLEKAEPLHE